MSFKSSTSYNVLAMAMVTVVALCSSSGYGKNLLFMSQLTDVTNFELSLRALHTYPDLSVALLSHSSLSTSVLNLSPKVNIISPPASSKQSPDSASTLLITRVHRVSKVVRWAVAITGMHPITVSSSTTDINSNLFIAGKTNDDKVVLMKFSFLGKLIWRRYITNDVLVHTIRWTLPNTLVLSISESANVIFFNASNGSFSHQAKLNSPKDSQTLAHDAKHGTACFLSKLDSISTISPQTSATLYISCTRVGNKLATPRTIQVSSNSQSTTFTQGVSITLDSLRQSRKATCKQVASVFYERAFNFDWSSRDVTTTQPPHELMIIRLCVHPYVKVIHTRNIKLPPASFVGMPQAAVFGFKYTLNGSKVALLFQTSAQLTGNVIDDRLLQERKAQGDFEKSPVSWLLLSSVNKGVKLVKVDQVVAKASKYDRVSVKAFDVTTSGRKVVVAGLLEGSNKDGSRFSGSVSIKTVKVPVA